MHACLRTPGASPGVATVSGFTLQPARLFIKGNSSMATAKKTAATTAAPAKRAPNAAFMKAMTPSAELAAVIGSTPLPRTEVTKKIWEYIKANNLQDAANKRNINADAKLKPIFGKDQVTMFELTKLVSQQLS
jgi:chromatin remodeling complex protein RSC6